LEGTFGGNPEFLSASYKIENLESMMRAAAELVEDIVRAPISEDNYFYTISDYRRQFDDDFKPALIQLRIKLEGKTWYNYGPNITYQVIGNQPNPDQTANPTQAPQHRKSTRTASKTRKALDDSISGADVAETLVSLSGGSKDKKNTSGLSLAYKYLSPANKARLAAATSVPSFTPINPSPLSRAPAIDKDEKIAQRE
jgi:hypothetical protein